MRWNRSCMHITAAISLAVISTLEILNAVYYKQGVWISFLGPDVNRDDDAAGGGDDDGDGGRTHQHQEPQWCEATNSDHERFIMEPANARSDYVYIFFGIWVVVMGVLDLRQGHTQKRMLQNENSDDEQPMILELAPPSSLSIAEQERDGDEQEDEKLAVDMPEVDQFIEEEMPIETRRMPTNSVETIHFRNFLMRNPHISIFNGMFNLLHGLGSFFYHACQCNTWFGGKADVAGMMAVISFAVFYGPLLLLPVPMAEPAHGCASGSSPSSLCGRNNASWCSMISTHRILSVIPPLGQLAVYLITIFDTSFLSIGSSTAVTIMISLIIALHVTIPAYIYLKRNKNVLSSRGNPRMVQRSELKISFAVVTFVSFFLGYGAWILDVKKIWCFRSGEYNQPLTWFQGHAAWHILTCGSLLCIYLFYRTEVVQLVRAPEQLVGEMGEIEPITV